MSETLDAQMDPQRRALLRAMLELAPFEGWSQRTLSSAAATSGVSAGRLALLVPGGVVELLDVWAAACDQATRDRLAQEPLAEMRVRERVTLGVRARFEAIGDAYREAARRGAARLALPDAAPRGVRIGWRAADAIWRGIGDTSTDGNFYSKRVILSGVLTAVAPAWFNADGPDDPKPWRVLDERIANVMQFEKAKAQWRKTVGRAPSLVEAVARFRYPRRPI